MTSEKIYPAVVEKVIREGSHGPYAVANSEELGYLTFSLSSSVWQEEDWPEPGTLVILEKITKKRAGWRAHRGRFYKPSDEQQKTVQSTERS